MNKKLLNKVMSVIVFCIIGAACASTNLKKQSNYILLNGDSNQKRFVPKNYRIKNPKQIKYNLENLKVNLYSRQFAQGDAVYFQIIEKNQQEISNIKCFYNNKKVYLTKKAWGYNGYLGIHANTRPGKMKLQLEYLCNQSKCRKEIVFKVIKKKFHVAHSALDLGKYSDPYLLLKPEIKKYIEECYKRKKSALATFNIDFIENSLAHPRDMNYITSPFWATRIIKQYRKKNGKKINLKSRVKIHRGTDFRGKKGTPVFAMAAGKIVLAEEMFYQGKYVIIDHGYKKYSHYMHLNKIIVKKGNFVKAGDQIAEVGSTGRSTAPHLHVSFEIDKVQVDPLSILSLPVRD